MCIEEKKGGTLAQLARLSEMDRDISLCFSAADYPLPRQIGPSSAPCFPLRHLVLLVESHDQGKQEYLESILWTPCADEKISVLSPLIVIRTGREGTDVRLAVRLWVSILGVHGS